MKALKDFFHDNYIFLLTLYVAVVLFFRECAEEYALCNIKML